MASVTRSRPSVLSSGNFEILSWYYFRISGILLLFMAVGHMMLMHLVVGVENVNYAFVASQWANPLWRLYDWFLLILSLTHGTNGIRIIVNDYIHNNGVRLAVMTILWLVTIALLVMGTQVVVTFPMVTPMAK